MKKILAVDDNLQNLYMLEIMLKTNGYEVETAANGKVALELAKKNPPDMIISDILMPIMDGFTLCRAWKVDDQLKSIPLVFYTASYTDPKDEAFALSLGAERYLAKPYTPEDLLNAMQEVFLASKVGKKVTPHESPYREVEFYKDYSETIARKLEEKMIQLERANNRLTVLYQASCDLITFNRSIDLIQSVMQSIVESAGYSHAIFFEYDASQKKLFFSRSVGVSDETKSLFKDRLSFNLGEEKGLTGLVAQTGQIINIADISKDPRWIPMEGSVKSALFVPVNFESILLGIVALFSIEIDAFSKEDEQNVASLTNSLAIAIENKKNQERVQKQLLRLSALHNIDQAINGSMDLLATLNIVLAHVAEQLNVDAADIILLNKYSLAFDFATGRGFITHTLETHDVRQRIVYAEKAIMERRTIHVDGSAELQQSSSFASMWAAEGFSGYWGVPLIAKGEVKGVLEVFQRIQFNPDPEWLDYLETLASQAAIAIANAEMFEGLTRSNIELRMAYDATIEGWSLALDLRDKETEAHTQRVVEKTLELAVAMGISNEELVHIKRGALLHDIGKMGVPDEILHKPGPLTDEEWVIMKKHPQFAYEMLSPISYLHRALDIPCSHHEKWDGTGYPLQKTGEQIPLAARLFAVVDVWDALRSDRPYRKAWPVDAVLDYIQKQSGTHFDPEVVKVFLGILKNTS